MRQRGLTLIEVVVAAGLFSLASLVLLAALKAGSDTYLRIESRDQAQRTLLKVARIVEDLEHASPEQFRSKRITTYPGAGDAVWFLSAIDPKSTDPRRFKVHPDGSPHWQRHVIYYLIRPLNHDQISGGISCDYDPNTEGDAFCPHKFLIRKVVNRPGDPETLMSAGEVDRYLEAPGGYSLENFKGEPGLVEADLVASPLLWFKAGLQGDMVVLNVRAGRTREAERVLSVGKFDLDKAHLTFEHDYRVVPQN